MNMKRILLAAAALFAVLSAGAQEITAGDRSERMLNKGYRGYVGVGTAFNIEDTNIIDVFGAAYEVTTTHGYQFSPHFFLGAGMAVQYVSTMEVTQVPLFGEAKFSLLKKWVTPFVDFKAGYTVSKNKGVYLNPTVGVRFGFSRHFGMNVSVGYSYHGDAFDGERYLGMGDKCNGNFNALNFRVAFDF